jgi:hypothetical protein
MREETFIKKLTEDGTKADALQLVQQLWDENNELRVKLAGAPTNDIRCTILITETLDGELSINSIIPDKAEQMLVGELTLELMRIATRIMNETLGEDKEFSTQVTS